MLLFRVINVCQLKYANPKKLGFAQDAWKKHGKNIFSQMVAYLLVIYHGFREG